MEERDSRDLWYMDDAIRPAVCAVPDSMTLLRLLKAARKLYPTLSWYDILIAGLEELLNQNARVS